jgi:hypothetical protein
MEDKVKIEELLRQVEVMCKREMRTPRDFDWLSGELEKMGERLSPTTLKRTWGYLTDTQNPRLLTLNILSHYLGYRDFTHFAGAYSLNDEPASNPVVGKCLHPLEELSVNARVMLTWQPGRMCIIRHLGNGLFVVEEAERTRLKPGNTFHCGLIIEGEQLYVNDLVQDNNSARTYCCGLRNGVHFKVL